jgi:hypothetical protein
MWESVAANLAAGIVRSRSAMVFRMSAGKIVATPSYESEDVPALLDELEDTPRSQAQTPGDERRGPLLDGWGGHQR